MIFVRLGMAVPVLLAAHTDTISNFMLWIQKSILKQGYEIGIVKGYGGSYPGRRSTDGEIREGIDLKTGESEEGS